MQVRQISGRIYDVTSDISRRTYTVVSNGGKFTCTCKDYLFRGMRHDCKHIRAVKGILGGYD